MATGTRASADPVACGSAVRRRNRRGEGALLRDEIVAAAKALLVEEGYESAVTLRAVARRVGIAAQSVYGHFAGPEEILQAVVVDTFAQLQCHIDAAFDAGSEAAVDPRERLFIGCRAYISFGLANPNLYGLLFRRNRLLRGNEATPDPATGADDRDPASGPFGVLVGGVQGCIDAGISDATSALQTAVELWFAMHGLVMLLGEQYQFPWPPYDALETDMIEAIARLRLSEPTASNGARAPRRRHR